MQRLLEETGLKREETGLEEREATAAQELRLIGEGSACEVDGPGPEELWLEGERTPLKVDRARSQEGGLPGEEAVAKVGVAGEWSHAAQHAVPTCVELARRAEQSTKVVLSTPRVRNARDVEKRVASIGEAEGLRAGRSRSEAQVKVAKPRVAR